MKKEDNIKVGLPRGFTSWSEVYQFLNDEIEEGRLNVHDGAVFITQGGQEIEITLEQAFDGLMNEKLISEDCGVHTPILHGSSRVGDLTPFELESIILTTLEKFFSSKFIR